MESRSQGRLTTTTWSLFFNTMGEVIYVDFRERTVHRTDRASVSVTESLYDQASIFDEFSETYAEAEKMYREVLTRDPEHVSAMLNLGNLLYVQDRKEEGVLFWRSVLVLDPKAKTEAGMHARHNIACTTE